MTKAEPLACSKMLIGGKLVFPDTCALSIKEKRNSKNFQNLAEQSAQVEKSKKTTLITCVPPKNAAAADCCFDFYILTPRLFVVDCALLQTFKAEIRDMRGEPLPNGRDINLDTSIHHP